MSDPVITIRNLVYAYPDGTQALKGVDLEVHEGESLALIGPNGAGKSTLLLHLNGILSCDQGEITVLGLPVNDRNLPRIRSQVGFVFQNPDNQLFMPTVFEDVAFGPISMGRSKEEVDAAVRRALDQVDMLDTMRRSSHHLSFGQKKRVTIATVLSMEPRILVLDEPTSNLDSRHRRSLMELLGRLDFTKVIATHDLEMVVELCSRTAIIDDGRIVAQGGTRDILMDKALLEAHALEVPHSLQFHHSPH